jgi:hypothetical protein
MKKTRHNYFILLLLTLVFAAPGITAYLCYQHPKWLGASTNKGKLIVPPVLFPSLEEGKEKWRLILWNPHSCEDTCLQQLDKLARIRLALGRHWYDVEQWLVLQSGNQLSHSLPKQDIHVFSLAENAHAALSVLKDQPEVFIANPKGQLILAYTMIADSADIYHDLKQLIVVNDRRVVKTNAK